MKYTAAVITVSDNCANGVHIDTTGSAVSAMLKEAGFDVIYTSVVPDERHLISSEIIKCEYEIDANLIITTGGTGLSKRDVTPQATLDVLDFEIPAITQAMLFHSLQITPNAMLTRAVAGVRNDGLIINLPGSEKAASENLSAIIDTLQHAVWMITSDRRK